MFIDNSTEQKKITNDLRESNEIKLSGNRNMYPIFFFRASKENLLLRFAKIPKYEISM